MLVCFTRKEGKLMVKRELENLKLIYEIRNQEGCTVIHWKIKFFSEFPIGFIHYGNHSYTLANLAT